MCIRDSWHTLLFKIPPKSPEISEWSCSSPLSWLLRMLCLCENILHYMSSDAVALLLRYQTCDLQVVDLSPGWAPLHSGLGQARYLHLSASVTKQCNLAEKVTVGLMESNGSYHQVYDWCHLRADCQETGISSVPSARNWIWDHFTLLVKTSFIVYCVVLM